MNGWVYVFHLLNSLFDCGLHEGGITVVFPNPVTTKLLKLGLHRIVFQQFLDFDLLDFRLLLRRTHRCFVKICFCWRVEASSILRKLVIVGVALFLGRGTQNLFVLLLFLQKLFLFIFVFSHMLDCFECDQSRNGNLHRVGISLNHVSFGEFVSFGDQAQNIC
jgi:hypothetical protein